MKIPQGRIFCGKNLTTYNIIRLSMSMPELPTGPSKEILDAVQRFSLYSPETFVLTSKWRQTLVIVYPDFILEMTEGGLKEDPQNPERSNRAQIRAGFFHLVDEVQKGGIKVVIFENPQVHNRLPMQDEEKVRELLANFVDLTIPAEVTGLVPSGAAISDLLKQHLGEGMSEPDIYNLAQSSWFLPELLWALASNQQCLTVLGDITNAPESPDFFRILPGRAKRIKAIYMPMQPMFTARTFTSEAARDPAQVLTQRPGTIRRRINDRALDDLQRIGAEIKAFFQLAV